MSKHICKMWLYCLVTGRKCLWTKLPVLSQISDKFAMFDQPSTLSLI